MRCQLLLAADGGAGIPGLRTLALMSLIGDVFDVNAGMGAVGLYPTPPIGDVFANVNAGMGAVGLYPTPPIGDVFDVSASCGVIPRPATFCV